VGNFNLDKSEDLRNLPPFSIHLHIGRKKVLSITMGCMQSSVKEEGSPLGTTGGGKITKASRRDSVAVHKRHLKKQRTAENSAPKGMVVEVVEDK
jgi:hypothetical protein